MFPGIRTLRRSKILYNTLSSAFVCFLFIFYLHYSDKNEIIGSLGYILRLASSNHALPGPTADNNKSVEVTQGLALDNHNVELVVSSMKNQDTSWYSTYFPDWKSNIYVVNDPSSSLTVPRYKGHEAMTYLTYISHVHPSARLYYCGKTRNRTDWGSGSSLTDTTLYQTTFSFSTPRDSNGTTMIPTMTASHYSATSDSHTCKTKDTWICAVSGCSAAQSNSALWRNRPLVIHSTTTRPQVRFFDRFLRTCTSQTTTILFLLRSESAAVLSLLWPRKRSNSGLGVTTYGIGSGCLTPRFKMSSVVDSLSILGIVRLLSFPSSSMRLAWVSQLTCGAVSYLWKRSRILPFSGGMLLQGLWDVRSSELFDGSVWNSV